MHRFEVYGLIEMTINFFELSSQLQANFRAASTRMLAGQYYQLLAI
jgi:hypothetical protein